MSLCVILSPVIRHSLFFLIAKLHEREWTYIPQGRLKTKLQMHVGFRVSPYACGYGYERTYRNRASYSGIQRNSTRIYNGIYTLLLAVDSALSVENLLYIYKNIKRCERPLTGGRSNKVFTCSHQLFFRKYILCIPINGI